jgi:death-on-curing protein
MVCATGAGLKLRWRGLGPRLPERTSIPSRSTKAAALLESVIKNHPFVDGNKRAGYTLDRLTLITFDLDLQATDDEEYDMVIQVATGQLDVEGIVAWMKDRVVAVS